jgi:hypothetical protein
MIHSQMYAGQFLSVMPLTSQRSNADVTAGIFSLLLFSASSWRSFCAGSISCVDLIVDLVPLAANPGWRLGVHYMATPGNAF